MRNTGSPLKSFLMKLSPLYGCLLFLLLYYIATLYYPGGSQADKNAHGFSWVNNYFCNLLNETAIDGKHNDGRPIALFAMLILSATLSLFWFQFPRLAGFNKTGVLLISYSGTASMATALFIFTRFHDTVINIAGLFGLIALVGTYVGLYKNKLHLLFYFGIVNLLLIALNNYIYYSASLLIYLPVIQKISLLFFLVWICLIDNALFKRTRRVAGSSEACSTTV